MVKRRKKEELKKFIRSRPSIFWWTLAHLLAAAFAVISWTTCLYIFRFPERASNYQILRKLKRLTPITEFTPADSPEGDPADPKAAFKKFFPLDAGELDALNTRLKRNYITNFKEPGFLTYVEGDFRITDVEALTSADLFHPGLALRAQAVVELDERDGTADYPVVIELLLPTAEEPPGDLFRTGEVLSLARATHRAAVLAVTKLGSREEPLICLTAVPLAYEHLRDIDKQTLPLAPPDPLNVTATFPAMEVNRPEE